VGDFEPTPYGGYVVPRRRAGFHVGGTEVLHLLIALSILILAFSFFLGGYRYLGRGLVREDSYFDDEPFLQVLVIAAVAMGTGFILHELMHKFVAQYFGHWAEFRLHPVGLILAVPIVLIAWAFCNRGKNPLSREFPSAVLVCSEQAVREHGLRPRARIHFLGVRAADPIYMLTAPIPATALALRKTGLSIDDIDLVEINEAFACVPLAWQRETGADLSKVNVNGGAVALGHPIGASGARILTTLLYALRERKLKRGIATLCLGGGNGVALAVERI